MQSHFGNVVAPEFLFVAHSTGLAKSTSLGCLFILPPPCLRSPPPPYPFVLACCCSSCPPGPSLANFSLSLLITPSTLSRLRLHTINLPWISAHCFSPKTRYVALCTRNSCFIWLNFPSTSPARIVSMTQISTSDAGI